MRPCVYLMSCLLSPAPAFAQSNTLAVHPLMVAEMSEKDEIQLRKLFIGEVKGLEERFIDPDRVREYLKSFPHRTCAAEPDLNACLAQVAKGMKAKRTLFVRVDVQPRIKLVGRIVRDDGELLISGERSFGKLVRATRSQTLKRAFRQFLASDMFLGLPDLPALVSPPPEPQLASPPPALTVPEPAPPAPFKEEEPLVVTEVVERSAWKSTLGWSALGAGAVAGGLGVFFKVQSSNSWSEFNSSQGYLTPRQVQDLSDLKSRAENQGTAGTLLLVGGGVLVAGGATLLVLDLMERAPSGSVKSVRLLPMLNGLAVAGTFQ